MPIGNRDLNADEFNELGVLKDRIADRVRVSSHLIPEGEYPMIEVTHAYDSFDLDTMRVYDKLLHLVGYSARPISLTVTYLHDAGIHEASPWLTANHVVAYTRIYMAVLKAKLRTISTDNETYVPNNLGRVCSLVFPDYSNADLIESIVNDRGITNFHEIDSLLKEMKLAAHHPATRSGAL